jgi:hypothetical protein
MIRHLIMSSTFCRAGHQGRFATRVKGGAPLRLDFTMVAGFLAVISQGARWHSLAIDPNCLTDTPGDANFNDAPIIFNRFFFPGQVLSRRTRAPGRLRLNHILSVIPLGCVDF